MKIVVMSDTHLDHVTEEFEELCDRYCEGADLVIHLGDMVSGALLQRLEQYPLEAVAGNSDDGVVRLALPDKKLLRIGAFRVGIIHGYGSSMGMRGRLANEFPGADAVLFGHTHVPLQMVEGGVTWFNPGSVFSGRGECRRSIGLLHVGARLDTEIIRL